MSPAVAQDLIAAVQRLAHAELALHALVCPAGDTTGMANAKRSAGLPTAHRHDDVDRDADPVRAVVARRRGQ